MAEKNVRFREIGWCDLCEFWTINRVYKTEFVTPSLAEIARELSKEEKIEVGRR